MEAAWPSGRVVRVLDFESAGPGFESHSEHITDLFHGSPGLLNPSAALVNSQPVCLPLAGVIKTCHVSFAIFVSVV